MASAGKGEGSRQRSSHVNLEIGRGRVGVVWWVDLAPGAPDAAQQGQRQQGKRAGARTLGHSSHPPAYRPACQQAMPSAVLLPCLQPSPEVRRLAVAEVVDTLAAPCAQADRQPAALWCLRQLSRHPRSRLQQQQAAEANLCSPGSTRWTPAHKPPPAGASQAANIDGCGAARRAPQAGACAAMAIGHCKRHACLPADIPSSPCSSGRCPPHPAPA